MHVGTLVGNPEAITDGSFGSGSGPIFLDDLRCVNQQSLLECPSRPHGVVTCSHSNDVGVRCPGTIAKK